MKYLIQSFILSVALLSGQATAQNKTIEIVVPATPGGTGSNIAQLIADILTDKGQPAIVVNKPGADSVIGVNYAAKAKPDGKTLLLGAGSALAANIVFGATGMEYDENSFTPIVPLGTLGWVIYTPPNLPIKNIDQLKFYIKANPEKFNIGFWNNNYAKLLLAWAQEEGLPRPQIISYKGGSPLMTDVMGGHVLMGVDNWFFVSQNYAAGKLNVIASFDDKIVKDIQGVRNNKDVVSITDRFPQFNFTVWYGLYAPAGTPKSVIDSINQTVNSALKEPKFAERARAFKLHNFGGDVKNLNAWQQRDLKMLNQVKKNYD
jgi:tripartite-type tricarboxylate transporter receptor subunit TctC